MHVKPFLIYTLILVLGIVLASTTCRITEPLSKTPKTIFKDTKIGTEKHLVPHMSIDNNKGEKAICDLR